mgnify:CR=1 FL=1
MKVGTGNVSALLSGDGLDMVNDLLAKVAPNAKNLIESEFEKIYQNAYENWPVRKIRKRTSTGLIRESARQMTKDRSDWNFKQALAVAYSLQKKNKLVISESVREKKREFAITNKSQFSKNKLYVGIKLTTNSEIEFVIGNTAVYAWAIKIGVDSDSSLPLGARVANEYLWKPAKKQANQIADALGNDLKKLL